jgi:aminomethyltransferase
MATESQVHVTDGLRRSPLHDRHVADGARLVPFAGWEMPVQYSGIRAEHQIVRTRAGVFDVSHMGQVGIRGPQAQRFLQRMLSNDLGKLAVGGAQYSLLCQEDGGVLDDLFTYRLGDDAYLTVTNAANHARDLSWLRSHAEPFDVELVDRIDDFAMLAVQGPDARSVLSGLADGALPARFQCCERTLAGVPALICGTGYTGEDGCEVLLDPTAAAVVWDALLSARVEPAGLGARDTLRLEVCYHLYGNDLMVERGPIEGGLGWACAEATDFIGSGAVARTRASGPAEKLAAFVVDGSAIARQGNAIVGGGAVTSGTFSPSLERGIGMAYLPAERAEPGTRIEIDVRGSIRPATVVRKPIYSRG